MNILQVSKYYYPTIGGVEDVVQTIAEGLSQSQWTVRVLTSREFGIGYSNDVNDISVYRTSSLGELMSVPIAPAFPLRIYQHTDWADIVHLHLPNPLSVVSQTIADPSSSKLIATYHSDIVKQRSAAKFYRPLLDSFLARTDRIIVTSPSLLEHSKVLAPYRDKCEIVPPTVDLDAIDRLDALSSDEILVDRGAVILFVGRLVYYKGLEHLIDAMKNVDATLLVAGSGPRRAALVKQAKNEGVANRVRFLGRITDDRLHQLYEQADVFVLPSVEPSEAFGIVQLEAMAHETPVINTSLPTGVPWVSKDGETGLTVPPRDSSALSKAINELLSNPDRRRELGRNGRRRVQRHFTHEVATSKVEQIYCDVFGN
ncbi:glycosyltransferase [Natronomonas salina]|uniref:glycosyltransferase n=1 Tax=Natronomonas salina TaxID=1710540 RepID=UPI0015B38992|nr:glycosyltransferase [Natronomonas salina]QLD90792.1 glycosyltransferase [Natronomonas salina]